MPTNADIVIRPTGWLKMKYPNRQNVISPQPVPDFKNS